MSDLGPLPSNPDHPGSSSDDGRVAELLRDRLDHALVDAVAALLFEADPAGVADGDNTEEYLVEATMIVVGLPGAANVGDVAELTHRVFTVWFDAAIAGPVGRYGDVAAKIWDALQQHRNVERR